MNKITNFIKNLSWHEVLGLLAGVGGVITAVVGSGALPETVSKLLIEVGGFITTASLVVRGFAGSSASTTKS